jgi:hypothetical protein
MYSVPIEVVVRIYTRVQILEINYTNYRTVRKWCTKQFGASVSKEAKDAGRPWYAKRRWIHIQRDSGLGQVQELVQESAFYFRDPAHATMFQLVWAK